MDNFILILSLMLVGKALAHLTIFPRDSAKTLNLYVLYIALPALILLKIPKLDFSSELLIPVVMPWIMLGVTALLILLLARIFHWQRATTGALLLVTPLGNTSFLGIPMVQTFFGDDRVPLALLYDQFGSFLALTTYGAIIVALYGSAAKPTVATLLKQIFLFPPFLALIVALLIKHLDHPAPLDALLTMTANSLVPVVMTAVGFQLKIRLSPTDLHPLSIGLLLKLVGAPLLALAGCLLFQLDSPAARVAVFEAGMPPMITAGALALLSGLAPELTAAMVSLGIIASFVTLPLLFHLMRFLIG